LIAPEGRIAVRRDAPLHVQIELAPFSPDLRPRSGVEIQGHVVRVFRGDGLTKPGDFLSFDLWVCEEGDEPTGPAFVYYKDLLAASHLEAYLFGTPPKCMLGAYEFTLLDGPTLDPRMSVQELVELMQLWTQESELRPETRRWWQFWKR
jgi:hypothetical protein